MASRSNAVEGFAGEPGIYGMRFRNEQGSTKVNKEVHIIEGCYLREGSGFIIDCSASIYLGGKKYVRESI